MKVTVFHNMDQDHFSGCRPGHPLVRVHEAEVPDGLDPWSAAELMFEIGNAPEECLAGKRLLEMARAYRARQLRSLSAGDVVVAGEIPLACGRAGWSMLDGPVNEVFTGGPGSVPLSLAERES